MPRTSFKNDPSEERQRLLQLDGKYNVYRVKDNRGFWRIECDCTDFHKQKPGCAKGCAHVMELMKTHADVNSVVWLEPQVRVTAIVNPGLEAWFRLDDADENDFRQVTLCVVDHTSPADRTRFFQQKPMGLLHKNSGRLELRHLVLEWIISLSVEGLACRAHYHAPGQSPYENMDAHITSRGNPGFPVLVDLFDLYTTGNCRACNENSAVPEL